MWTTKTSLWLLAVLANISILVGGYVYTRHYIKQNQEHQYITGFNDHGHYIMGIIKGAGSDGVYFKDTDGAIVGCILVSPPTENQTPGAPEGSDEYHPSGQLPKNEPGAVVGPSQAIPDPGPAGAGQPNGRFKTRS